MQSKRMSSRHGWTRFAGFTGIQAL